MNSELTQFYQEIADSIVKMDEEAAFRLARMAIASGYDLLQTIEHGFAEGIRQVGVLYDKGEYYLPELMVAAKIMENTLAILIPKIEEQGMRDSKGKILLATVEGDIHSIGKDIVGTLLRANGFTVVDLGTDVSINNIIKQAEHESVDIIGLSALLTTTIPEQKRIIKQLEEQNLRNKYKVILGGAPVDRAWADECGADGYAVSATEAVTLVKHLIREL